MAIPARASSGVPGGRLRAFTLIELLVVIAIILLLVGITTSVLFAAITRTRVAQARSEIMQIGAALQAYHHEFGAYPPDTGNWNEATFDPRAIHRYLARELVDPKTGKPRAPFMGIPAERLRDRDAGGAGVYTDPWGNPYGLDAAHMARVAGKWQKVGEPYLPSRTEAERTRPFKVMSFGPDGVTDPAYPFDWSTLHPDARDDVRSW